MLGRTTLGPPERKMRIVPCRSGIQVQTQGVSRPDPRIFHRTRLTRPLLLGKWDGTDIRSWFAPPYCHRLKEKVPLKDDLQASTFQAVCDSQFTECRERYLPSRKERYQKRVYSQPSILQELFSFPDGSLPVLLRGTKFQSQGHVSPCTLQALQSHS